MENINKSKTAPTHDEQCYIFVLQFIIKILEFHYIKSWNSIIFQDAQILQNIKSEH